MEAKRSDSPPVIAGPLVSPNGHAQSTVADPATAEPANRRRFTWWQIPVWLGVLALLGLFAWSLIKPKDQPTNGQAPEISLTLFSGQPFKLSEQQGKVTVVNFWASWCVPCKDEAAELEQTWQKYRDQGVVFLGVDYVDTEPEALGFMKTYNVSYPNGPDTGTKISQAYRIKGVPETFIVDANGQIAFFKEGPMTSRELSSQIEPLLAAVKK